MTGKLTQRYADVIATRSKILIVGLLLVTGFVAAGVAMGETEQAGIGEFEVDDPATRASDDIQANYTTDQAIVSQIVIREGDRNALSKESILAGLELQQSVRANETLNETLQGPGLVGIENIVGTVAVFETSEGPPPTGQPPLEKQIAAIQSLSDEDYEQVLTRVLARDAELPGSQDPYQFLPESYDPNETSADSRLTLVFQEDNSDPDTDPLAAYDAQVTIGSLLEEQFEDAFIFGQGISNDASQRAVGDSFAIITPVALVLVLFALGITYRDVVDIILGCVGIVLVLLWQAGIQGWLNIPMSQILIAVPFLLIGLSIDYALHVVMRYREARTGTLDSTDDPVTDGGETPDEPDAGGEIPESETDRDHDEQNEQTSDSPAEEDTPENGIRTAMAMGLSGVVLALAAATFSTAVGFLSNVVSPLPAVKNFAILSAGGIVATCIIFAALLPALKVEIDGLIENRLGRSRKKEAFGVEAGVANGALSGLAGLVSRVPLAVIGVAFLLASAGAVGATTIDTEFNEADFLPEEPPEWTTYLPDSFEPGTYTIKDNFAYISQNYQLQGPDDQAEILIRDGITDGSFLTGIEATSRTVGENSSIGLRADGTAALQGPNTVIRSVARDNETVATAIADRDTNDDGLPDTELESFYDILFDADREAASSVIHRTEDGSYESARLIIGVRGTASSQDVARDTRSFAATLEQNTDSESLEAVATGGPVSTAVIQDALLETLVESFVVTLVVILAFLLVLYWVRYRAPMLAVITLLPVVGALCWLLGTMAVLGIPFNSETAIITSLAIGLGVDYSIHVGERFADENERQETLRDALQATITGTGGALLGSATTTAAGFGVLALALSPPLQRFGLVTGTAIVFAFIACLTILPCLLVVRERVIERLQSG